MKDSRFRDSLPVEMKDDIAKYLHNPGCGCNTPIYQKLLKIARPQLQQYFPGSEIDESEVGQKMEEQMPSLGADPPVEPEYSHSVINCHVDELSQRLEALPKGKPRQVSIARFEDQITCVITEVDMRRNMKSQKSWGN